MQLVFTNFAAYSLRCFRYTVRAFSIFPTFMLKNILLVILILLPAALYIYVVNRDDSAQPAESKQLFSAPRPAAQPAP